MKIENLTNRIFNGDCLEVLKQLPDEIINCCVTSPPYWGLRDYETQGQIGLEKTMQEYIDKMVLIFSEVKRILKKDGTLWLNLGDTYNSIGGNSFGGKSSLPKQKCFKIIEKDLKPKDLCGVPWTVVFALRADGWYLRQDIIWHKSNPMPESVTDRCTKSHEYIFLLSKNQKYYYDADAIKEKAITAKEYKHTPSGWDTGKGSHNKLIGRYENRKNFDSSQGGGGSGFKGHSGNMLADGTTYIVRNKRSVWTVATKPYKDAHFATFPPELIKDCIQAGCPVGGIVLDPFMGSGTTAWTAKMLDRKYIGIELNAEYIKLAEERLIQERLNLT